MVADGELGIDEEFLGDRDFAGLLRHPPLLQMRPVKPAAADFLHGHLFFGAIDLGGHALRAFGLHGLDTPHLSERLHVVIGQPIGGLHLDVVQSLRVVEPVGGAEHVPASGIDAGQHGHTQHADHGDGKEPLPPMQPRAQHVFHERPRYGTRAIRST